MTKLGLLMAATMAATMMGATAHATVFDFTLTTQANTYTFALNDANGTGVSFGYDYGPVPVTSSSGVKTEDVGTFLGYVLYSDDFSFVGEGFTTDWVSQGVYQETFNPGTYLGTDNTEASNSETLVIKDAPAVSAAPEPGVWALMLAGVAMIGLTLRQGRRQRGMALTA